MSFACALVVGASVFVGSAGAQQASRTVTAKAGERYVATAVVKAGRGKRLCLRLRERTGNVKQIVGQAEEQSRGRR